MLTIGEAHRYVLPTHVTQLLQGAPAVNHPLYISKLSLYSEKFVPERATEMIRCHRRRRSRQEWGALPLKNGSESNNTGTEAQWNVAAGHIRVNCGSFDFRHFRPRVPPPQTLKTARGLRGKFSRHPSPPFRTTPTPSFHHYLA